MVFVLCCSAIASQLICRDMGDYVGGVDECVYVTCVVSVNVCWGCYCCYLLQMFVLLYWKSGLGLYDSVHSCEQ